VAISTYGEGGYKVRVAVEAIAVRKLGKISRTKRLRTQVCSSFHVIENVKDLLKIQSH